MPGLDGLLLHLPVESLHDVANLALQQRHGPLLRLHPFGVLGDLQTGGAGPRLLQQSLVGVENIRLDVLLPLLEPGDGDEGGADGGVELFHHLVPGRDHGLQALGCRSPHLPADIVVVRVFVIRPDTVTVSFTLSIYQ